MMLEIKEIKPNVSIVDSYLEQYATLKKVDKFEQVLNLYTNLRIQFPDLSPLFIFEDKGQCDYTNFHSLLTNFEELPDEIFEEPEHRLFEYIVNDLNNSKISLEEIFTKMYFTKEFSKLKNVNKNPIHLFKYGLDVKLCPTKNSNETFAAMVNGYFAGDFFPTRKLCNY